MALAFTTSHVHAQRPSQACRCRRTRPCLVRASMGPDPPSSRHKPQWLRILEEDAAVDEDVAELLSGTDGDTDKIRAKMQAHMSRGRSSSYIQEKTGSDTPPNVVFETVDPFNLWVWLRFESGLTGQEREMLDSALRSWFIVGKMGGYNSQNLQVYYAAGDDTSNMEYDTSDLSAGASVSYMHEMGELETRGRMARFRVDMGTADEIALDVLLNMLLAFSADVVGIASIQLGGDNESWPAPAQEEEWEGGEMPKVSIDPLRLPQGMDDELALLDELGAFQQQAKSKQQQTPAASAAVAGATAVAGASGSSTSSREWGAGWSGRVARNRASTGSRDSSGGRSGLEQRLRERFGAGADDVGLLREGMSLYSEEQFKREFGPEDEKGT